MVVKSALMALAVAETAAAGGYLMMAAAVEYPATYQNPEFVPLLLLFLSLLPVTTNGSLQESAWIKHIETRSNVHCQCLGLWVLHTRMCCRRNRELIFSTTHQRERHASKEKGIWVPGCGRYCHQLQQSSQLQLPRP